MTLEYLWIEDFRVFKKIGFNFSSKYRFTYDHESKRLQRSLNEKYIESFFGAGFSEITALIGENGVGKSTLFEFIIRNLTNFGNGGSNEYNDGDFFVVFSNLILVKNRELIKNQEELRLLGYKIEEYKETANLFLRLVGTGYEHIEYTYYSNVFDYKREYDSFQLNDISINNLLIQDSVDNQEHVILYWFVYAEIKRQIDFLTDIMFTAPFKLPSKLFIDISKNVYKYKHLIQLSDIEQHELGSIIQMFSVGIPENVTEKTELLLFQNLLKYRSFVDPETFKGVDSAIFQDILVKKSIRESELSPSQIEELRNILNVIEKFQQLLRTERIRIYDSNQEISIEYSISENNDAFFQFNDSINKLMGVDTFLGYSWAGISSGEKALLSLFGRLNFSRKNSSIDPDFSKKKVFLMIDECDLYFHPEWQRKLFKMFIDTLPLIFHDKESIQLVLSSHSPFIISDLPNFSIIFLKKLPTDRLKPNGEFNPVVEDSSKFETFGANIHTLLTNAFFLQDGLIGEFAKTKIFQIIDELEKIETLNEEEVNSYKKRISIIGEPMIRKKIFELLYKKVGNDDLWKRKEILLRELDELNNKLRNRNHEEG